MLIKNANIRGKEGTWQIAIKDGKIVEIAGEINETDTEEVLDVEGGLVIPPFIDAHTHIDTALTAGKPRWNASGTLFEAIELWEEIRHTMTHEDVRERARKVLKWQIANGVQYIRTHVDSSDPKLTALQAMLEIKEEFSPYVDLQIVAFPQSGLYTHKKGVETLETALKVGADAVGAIPHYEHTREDSVASVKKAFELAEKYDRLVDIHCDETDDDQSRALEVVAAEAYRREMGIRVTASHTAALGSYHDAYAYKLFGLLRKADINFIANPLINIHLQGRYDSYPKRRGLTRVKELMDAGLNVCFGNDDILDPAYSLGTGNLLQVLHMGVHVCHLTGYDQLQKSLDLITHNSAITLNIEEQYGLRPGNDANLIVLPARDDYDAVRRQVPVQYSIRQGQIIAQTEPAHTAVFLNNQEERVDFIH